MNEKKTSRTAMLKQTAKKIFILKVFCVRIIRNTNICQTANEYRKKTQSYLR